MLQTRYDPALLSQIAAAGFATPSPVRRTEADVAARAAEVAVPYSALRAVLTVEAPRGGFDARGRLTMLYEPHVAYRVAPSEAVRARLVAAGLAYKSWGTRPYPPESYTRFAAAYAIDPATAIQACSLGGPQILGSNYKVCGYASPQEMFVAFLVGGEPEQLRAMVAFVVGNKLVAPLRARNWPVFARGYNGPGYAKNKYDSKLASADAKWAAAPQPRPAVLAVPAPAPVLALPPPSTPTAPSPPAVQGPTAAAPATPAPPPPAEPALVVPRVAPADATIPGVAPPAPVRRGWLAGLLRRLDDWLYTRISG